MPTQFEQQPEPTEWPYFWSPEYDFTMFTNCICEDGWLPLPDLTMTACFVCNHDEPRH